MMMQNMAIPPQDLNGYINTDAPITQPAQQQQKGRGHRPPRKSNPNVKLDAMPIEEALKSMSIQELTSANNMKTPISVLQELLSRRGITPQYDLIQVEGAVHEPTFRYRVSYQDKDAMGTGKSKKEAKHDAARALIEKLAGIQGEGGLSMPVKTEITGDVDIDQNGGNPIGWLQEMCMSRRWPPPTYETELEVGLPHERQFTIACVVLKYREIGKGKSKKIAKRNAAHKMWQRLQDSPLDHNQIVTALDEDGNEEATCLNDKNVNYVQMLHEIAQEQRFEITYVDIDEKTHSGRFQCLVQLSTLPVAVCHGSGATSTEAQSNAARNSLEYLKIMTKT